MMRPENLGRIINGQEFIFTDRPGTDFSDARGLGYRTRMVQLGSVLNGA